MAGKKRNTQTLIDPVFQTWFTGTRGKVIITVNILETIYLEDGSVFGAIVSINGKDAAPYTLDILNDWRAHKLTGMTRGSAQDVLRLLEESAA